MVTVAREEARATGVAADVWVADAQDLGSGLGPYHVVTASLVLFFLPTRLRPRARGGGWSSALAEAV